MTKNQSLVFRSLLFFAGVGIIALAFHLINAGRIVDQTDVFIWVSIAVMYLVVFVPFFFSFINVSNFSAKIPSLTMVWLGIILYVMGSITLIVLFGKIHLFSLHTTIIIQAVFLFLFSIDIYFAYFASSHVQQVKTEESARQRYITEIKSKSGVLSLTVNSLPAGYENAQKILQQVIEDIKYLYPINAGAAEDLELKILQSLNMLSELCSSIATGANSLDLEPQAKKLHILVKERKLLRNQ